MQRLLHDLCDDLEQSCRTAAHARRLPLSYLRLLGKRLELKAFGDWKVVGWVEALNDLVYFFDLEKQVRRESDLPSFADCLLAECEEQFYEHGYKDELFPRGRPAEAGLATRIARLCDRLARQVVQESLFLDPRLPFHWLALRGSNKWEVPVDLHPDFERVEQGGDIPIGVEGRAVRLPSALRKRLAQQCWRGTIVIRRAEIRLRVDREETTLTTWRDGGLEWQHPLVDHAALPWRRAVGHETLSLGPTLIYGRRREPVSIASSRHELVERVRQAMTTIERAWPDGARLVAALTSRIIPLRARGVVSFSYRHLPGLSFINLFDRDRLDLIDDLIHENSHHHLNLLLRKYVLYRGDHNQEIFYSPWRRSLRPLRGILHATFTFTMGAILFERLSSWAGRIDQAGAKAARLSTEDVSRARFRCLEEIDSVRYSLRDLDYAARGLGWLTAAGQGLVTSLRREIDRVSKRIGHCEAAVLRSRYGPELRRHRHSLVEARQTYGPRKS